MSFCHCHSVIICGQTLIVARYRRNVISQTRKLRIRGLEITVRSNSSNSCLKSPQIDVRNLEAHEKCCTFALSIDGAARAMKARFQMAESRQRWTKSIRRQARTLNERHKAGCRPPDAAGRKESNTKKNTFKVWQRFCMK